jgi:hypothetical protein
MTYVVVYLTLMGVALVLNYALHSVNSKDDDEF